MLILENTRGFRRCTAGSYLDFTLYFPFCCFSSPPVRLRDSDFKALWGQLQQAHTGSRPLPHTFAITFHTFRFFFFFFFGEHYAL